MKCLFFLTLLSISSAASSSSGDVFSIALLHTNDIHSHFLQSDGRGANCSEKKAAKKECYGGIARIVTKGKGIKRSRKKNTLFF
uniref:Putative 5'-nucleotidase/apyrase n=1 Tax=Ixodes ricinus TaxID=34613 RepID=A0A0K8RK29_IXORI